jgi:YgiT-type zinc finger domain-containing protein
MKKMDKCPRCGFDDVVEKKVEELLRGGGDVAAVIVPACVCLHCGERMYSLDTAHRFDKIRKQLANGEVDDLQPMGRLFRVPAGDADA